MEIDNIYNMDCLEGMKLIPDGTIDAVICDLPYGTTANKWDSVIPFDKLWEQYRRICKPNAPIVLFGQEPFSTMLRMSNFDCWKYDWIWDKMFGGNFVNAAYQPIKTHEIVSVFCFGRCTYNPQMIKRRDPIKAGGNGQAEGKAVRLAINKHTEEFGKLHKVYHEKFPDSQLHFSVRSDMDNHFHPTQKPVDLLRYLVLTYTNEGDTVLDNCMGSGTTAIACIKERRHFIGFELSKEYFDKAVRRIDAEQRQLTLF